jgi:hypothetical protein
MKRYSRHDIKRALDCVNAIQAGDTNMLRSRRSAAAEALANYIFDLDDPMRTDFLVKANAYDR